MCKCMCVSVYVCVHAHVYVIPEREQRVLAGGVRDAPPGYMCAYVHMHVFKYIACLC